MDKFVELATFFIPQILVLFIVLSFIRQDSSSIFYINKYEDPKRMNIRNNLLLFSCVLVLIVITFIVSIFKYLDQSWTNFYDVGKILLGVGGAILFISFLYHQLFRNVLYDNGYLQHKKTMNSVKFSIDKITSISIKKGLIFPIIEVNSDNRKIMLSSFSSNIINVIYIIARDTNAINDLFINELFESHKFFERELEVKQLLLEVIKHD